MKVEFSVSTKCVGSEVKESVDLPDELTDDQIEQEWIDWRNENIDGHWSKE